MTDVREGRSAGWINLGLVSPPEAEDIFTDRVSQLPKDVKGAFPTLISVTPSITALVIYFLFNEHSAKSLEQPLKADYTTSIDRKPKLSLWSVVLHIFLGRPLRSSITFSSPDNLRQFEVKGKLKALEDVCVSWVKKRLPGSFSKSTSSGFPTAILHVTEEILPMSSEAAELYALNSVSLNFEFDAWESPEWPTGRMVLGNRYEREANRLIFACRRVDAFAKSEGNSDESSNWIIGQKADQFIRGILVRWALSCLLNQYHEAVAAMRDRVSYDGGRYPVRDLKRLFRLTRTLFYDIRAVTSELVEFTESKTRYYHDVLNMSLVRKEYKAGSNLLDQFRNFQNKRAKQVSREATSVSSALEISNNLTQTISSLRIQRLIILLTVISVSFTGLEYLNSFFRLICETVAQIVAS